MEVTQALKLNGYKYSRSELVSTLRHKGRIYQNSRGIEMMVVVPESGDASLGSTNRKALDFIMEILNGAHAG